jgi:Leucine-rich repeat (LRR) protein
MKHLCLFILATFFSCSPEYYDYHGEKIKIYYHVDQKKKDLVKGIDISKKNLSSLPSEVVNFKKLMVLNLRDNSINSIAELCELKDIRVLLLDRNPINNIPPCITELTNIEVLSIMSCGLITVPEWIFNLENIRILNIGGNQIPEKTILDLRNRLPNCKIISSVD